jgi:putative acetyltransferase
LLGPLAVLPSLRGKGCGKALVEDGLRRAIGGPWPLVLVSGEADYYPKFGFVPARDYDLQWPGFIESERLQFYELVPGALTSLPPGPLVVAPVAK